MLTVVHDIPGRLRLKGARLRGSEAEAARARAQAASVAGVTEVFANALTGSVLVCYSGEDTRERLLAELGAVTPNPANDRFADPAADGFAETIADALAKALVERLATLMVAALI